MNSSSFQAESILDVITSMDPAVRNQPVESIFSEADVEQLLAYVSALDSFRRKSTNLYYRVRSTFFLYAIHRFHLPPLVGEEAAGKIPSLGFEHLLKRRFPEALDAFIEALNRDGPSVTLCSALANAYHQFAFQTLASQVRRSVRTVRGNQWMFRAGHPADTPLRISKTLTERDEKGCFPVLCERTSVRMDFSHSGWSDIFFLGMDYPEGAKVINASIDLAVRGKHGRPEPPIECALRVIDEPVLRLVSIDLDAKADIVSLPEVYDFAADYLGLLKAAIIASGLVPPGMEGCDVGIEAVLGRLVGPGKGLELVSRVNGIPKGSRLAVSTNLLGSLITLCMRATGQVSHLTGGLQEADRRIVAARAILGEWLGGSGGGWQDSGGIWPGIKRIEGAVAGPDDPEHGISRGRLLPNHHTFDNSEISESTQRLLQDSLVLVHGGLAQNVGPILEMVTEKYLLRCPEEWQARQEALDVLKQIEVALCQGQLHEVGRLTSHNFSGPLQKIIPWCSNRYTERLIELCRSKFQADFWGFWMLGGMAGGGMGFIFAPHVKSLASKWLESKMLETKRELEHCLPFAMDPVVYDFTINQHGTQATLSSANTMPKGYYPLVVPQLLRASNQELSACRRAELEQVSEMCRDPQDGELGGLDASGFAARLLDRILPSSEPTGNAQEGRLEDLLGANGFDGVMHRQLKDDILSGRLGLAQNRLSSTTRIEDVFPEDVLDARFSKSESLRQAAEAAIARGEVATLTLAAGVGSRWTEGAGVVKALHPFCKFAGKHRNFLEVHLAKSRRVGRTSGFYPAHIISTGYMTDGPIRDAMEKIPYSGSKLISSGRNVGLRLVPTSRDLRFAWEEMPQQVLDEQQEKVRQSVRSALLNWAKSQGEATDYRDNMPMQCMHPVGHWYEIPNLLANGTLRQLLLTQPQTKHLLLHNIDTLGATIDPDILALHMTSGACLSYEVLTRRIEDRGGGLARVDGRPRLIEGLAMPDESVELNLSYYNSMTTWIDIDRLLEVFELDRELLGNHDCVVEAIRKLARRIPTYITLKDVKKRWGNGQEDIFPVTQFEKLWGDMTSLSEVDCQYIVVSTLRGQQLKEQSQLDGWLRDGSAGQIAELCEFDDQ